MKQRTEIKIVVLALVMLVMSSTSNAQNFFKPVITGGLEHVKTGKSFHLVEMPGKSATEIYHALLTMTKGFFGGADDEILETIEGKTIRGKGTAKRAICTFYDAQMTVRFDIKDGKYIFKFEKLNLSSSEATDGKYKKLLIRYGGSNLLRNDTHTQYLLRKNGKPTLANKQCYKDLIRNLDFWCKYFDISDEFEKYSKMKSEEEDW